MKITKKPVKKVNEVPVGDRVDMLSAMLTDVQHRLSNYGARLDGAWGKIATLGNAVEQLTLAPWKDPLYPNGCSLPAKPAAYEQFCVIGDKATHQYPVTRKWHSSQEQAEQYAASLCRNQPNCTELLVVKVVSKVGRKEPDIKVTRV